MGWDRKLFKREAKTVLKKNYAKLVLVCIVLLLFVGEFSGTKEAIFNTPLSVEETGDEGGTSASENRTNDTQIQNKVLNDVVNGIVKTEETKDALVKQIQDYRPTRGIVSQFFNSVSSVGNFSIGMLNAMNNLVFKNRVNAAVIIGIGTILELLLVTFVMQNIGIGAKRIFLESRRYYGTKIERILFLFQIKRVIRSGFVLLRTTVYQMLWSFTIIGFFIKKYAYYMVPFIVAENPDIKGKDAITLSRQMMNGYKWKMFVMDLTFLGWSILNAVTFGLLGIFFINPYRTATDTEVYIALRRRAIEEKLPLAALFTDQYLDVEKAVDAEYPIESFPIPIAEHRKWLNIDYRKNYSIQHLILIYFCFAFIGWCWEVGLHLMSDGTFVNRGVLFGPWLPIYGTGGILVLVLLKPFREKRILTFALSTLICGIVEYTTSYYLEMTHGMKWWDYSGYFLNINGRVCFEGLLVFGLGCLSIIYVVAPLLDNLLSKIPKKLGWAIAVLLLVLFIADNIHAKDHPNVGKGITDYQSRIDSEQNVNKIAKFI